MSFRRFSSNDPADIAGALNRLGDDLEDTVATILRVAPTVAADPSGVLARYAKTAQDAYDTAAALDRRTTATEAATVDSGWTTTGIVFRSGWSVGPPIGEWAPLRYRQLGKTVWITGSVQKTVTATVNEVMFQMPANLRPAGYWQLPRGTIKSDGTVLCPEASTITALSFSYPIG